MSEHGVPDWLKDSLLDHGWLSPEQHKAELDEAIIIAAAQARAEMREHGVPDWAKDSLLDSGWLPPEEHKAELDAAVVAAAAQARHEMNRCIGEHLGQPAEAKSTMQMLNDALRVCENASVAAERKLMACGHPNACLRNVPLAGTAKENEVHGCIACEHEAVAVEAARVDEARWWSGKLEGQEIETLVAQELTKRLRSRPLTGALERLIAGAYAACAKHEPVLPYQVGDEGEHYWMDCSCG